MALTATIYNFDIELADVDRGVYEPLSLRVACHPSETNEFLLTRVLAYCLEYTEGIGFGRGISEPGEAAISVRSLGGDLISWIDVGAPDVPRLHKASLTGARIVVYTNREPRVYLRQFEGERLHRSEELEVYSIDRDVIDGLVEHLDRRMKFSLSVTDRELYLTVGDETLHGAVERFVIGGK